MQLGTQPEVQSAVSADAHSFKYLYPKFYCHSFLKELHMTGDHQRDANCCLTVSSVSCEVSSP